MKIFKQTFKILALIFLISFGSCQEKYPDLEDGLYAEIITNKGTMTAKLFYDKVPVTVANFVALAEGNHPLVEDSLKNKPFYDNLIFHRVMDKFMIQGGDHTGSGRGNPGYRFTADFDSELKHNKPGILSMANSGGINTNGSQFFITEVPYPSLDMYDANGNFKPCDQPRVSCHSVFGELVKGLDVQDSISNVKVARGNRPVEDIVINKLNIIRKGPNAKAFNAPKVFEEEMPKVEERIAKIKEEEQKLIEERAKAAGEYFLRENENLEGRIEKLATGVIMIYTNESNGVKPTSGQKVLIDCAGYFENGQLFWTTKKEIAQKNNLFDQTQEDRGGYKPFSMIYNNSATLVPGFREAMLNMNVGDKARVFIPSFLGYGVRGRAPRIPPNTNLVFDIEIAGIDK